jgi:hypothetical protein
MVGKSPRKDRERPLKSEERDDESYGEGKPRLSRKSKDLEAVNQPSLPESPNNIRRKKPA